MLLISYGSYPIYKTCVCVVQFLYKYGTTVVSFHIKINIRKLVFCSNEYTAMVCLFLYIIKRWPCYSSTQCTTTSILVLFYYYFVERTQFVCNAAITLNTLMLHVQFVFPSNEYMVTG